MKKSWILLVLAALLVVALAMPAAAADASTPHCYCGGTASTGHKVTGCTGNLNQTWTAYTGTTLPTTAGYYYLSGNISGCAQASTEAAGVYLDLNGKTVTMNGGSFGYFLKPAANVTITDFVGGGTIKAAGTGTWSGGLIKVNATNATLNIYGGTLDGNGHTVTATGDATNGDGGGVIWNFGTVNMYNGTIQGGAATTSGDNRGGGNVFLTGASSKFNMYGGTITGGTATKGGNVGVYNGATFNLSGGVIENGKATVEDARHGGGNVYVMHSTSKVNMTGGTIRNGTAANTGGNVCIRWGTFNMSGGTITSTITDTRNARWGANVGLGYYGAYFNMTGGTISGGYASEGGAAIAIAYDGGHVTIGGTAKIDGGKAAYGAAIDIDPSTRAADGAMTAADATIEITGGTITGGTVTGSGGGMAMLQAGTTTISGGTVKGGTLTKADAAYGGGTFSVVGNAILNITGGTVNGGTCTTNGGTFFMTGSATVNISGGTVNAGTAKTGNCGYINAGTLNITGGETNAVSKFGGTVNVSKNPKVTINLGNNQYFSIPAALTTGAKVTYTPDDFSDMVAKAATKAIGQACLELENCITPYQNLMYVESDGGIYLAAVAHYVNGAKDSIWHLPTLATSKTGPGHTYKLAGNITVANLNNLADGTVVDLNGHTLTLTDSNVDLSGIVLADSATADYESASGYGKLAASVGVKPARSGVDTATNYRYLTVFDGTNYSSHRIYLAIKSAVLAPNGPSINFKTVLKCDEVVKGYVNGYGAQFTGTSTVKSPSTKAIASGNANTNEWITTLANASAGNFNNNFTSHAYITLNDRWTDAATVTSSDMTRSIQSMVEYASANLSTMNVYQTNALVNMYKKYSSYMTSWSIDALAIKANGGVSTT